MTSAHILYIPTIFLLGFLTGSLVGKGFGKSSLTVNDSVVSGKVLFGAFMIFAIIFVGTHFFEIPRSSKAVTKALSGLEIFDKKPSYNSDEVYSRIEMFPEDGRQLYKQFTYTIDLLFPITLFTFLFLLARFTNDRTAVARSLKIVFIVLPIVWLAMDFVENLTIYRLLDLFPIRNKALAGFLGYITITKFTLLLLSIVVPTALITRHNVRRRVSIDA